MLWMLCTQDASDAGVALHPRIFQTPGLLCTQDNLDAGDALDSGMLQILGMLRPPRLSSPPAAGLGSLQSSVPEVPELLRGRRCRCRSRSRQERQSSLRRGPGCSRSSPPGRRKIRRVGRDLSPAEERPARVEWVCAGASPTFTCCCGCTQRMQKCRSRRWGWGGEEEMK